MPSTLTNLLRLGLTRAVLSVLLIVTYTLLAPPIFGADNSVEIDTKGSNSSIYIDQIGTGNTARVWCGLSNGTYDTHTCSSATIDIDQDGTGNLAKATHNTQTIPGMNIRLLRMVMTMWAILMPMRMTTK